MTKITVDLREARCELARRSFWEYLKLTDPRFYKESRPHLKELAQILQDFSENKLLSPNGKAAKILLLNLPPRTGKSYTLTNFCSWRIGKTWIDAEAKTEQIITVSYNDDMAMDFSKYCRDNIIQERVDPTDIVFSDIFHRRTKGGVEQKCTVGAGAGGAKKWAVTGEFFNYLGAGFKGQITGKGASLGIIDDPIKNREEAYNDNTLEYIWNFYKNTFRSRIESGGRQIINHTRWRSEDLAGRILELYGDKVYVHKRGIVENPKWERVVTTDHNGRVTDTREKLIGGDLLCEELANWEDIEDFFLAIDIDILMANYFQQTLDIQGRLYQKFQTYDPDKFLPTGVRKNYTDTADTGDDYLSSICYIEYEKQAYVIDVVYTTSAMEVTEPEVANMLHLNHVNSVKIESNSGGRSFSRAVKRILTEDHKNHTCVVEAFAQSQNKNSRIHTNAPWVQNNIFFPFDWAKRWPMFHKALTSYQKQGKNKHDDAPDAITGVAENFQCLGGMPIFNPRKHKKRGFAQWQ